MTAEAKYLKVARILQKRIEDGVYKTQAPLPDQKTLADELQVSRLTVKKAFEQKNKVSVCSRWQNKRPKGV